MSSLPSASHITQAGNLKGVSLGTNLETCSPTADEPRCHIQCRRYQGSSYNTTQKQRRDNKGSWSRINSPNTLSPKSNRTLGPAQVFHSNFADMHSNITRAMRYKVHKPRCECAKMERLRSRNTNNQLNNLDGLIVLPDVINVKSVYVCEGTGEALFLSDPTGSELKLKEELFGSASSSLVKSFKVSCAACLLRDKPNGFVCITSPSRSTVDFARDMARKAADVKRSQGALHADHAHFVCSIPRHQLWIIANRENHNVNTKYDAKRHVLEEMERQEVSIGGTDSYSGKECHFKFGHHLTSLLYMTKQDSHADSTIWLVMGYDDSKEDYNPLMIQLDLPGGKRHLGEGPFECAMRETEEEVSLHVDETWLFGDKLPRESKAEDERGNVYYFLRPPPNLLVKELEENDLWKKANIGTD